MKGNRRFVVFILSHGRPDSVHTLKTLKSLGYSGDWLIVIDNEDETAERYYQNFGREKVVMFDKLAISKTFDTADTFEDRRTIVYARNACWDIAKERGYRYFLELDDDYTSFRTDTWRTGDWSVKARGTSIPYSRRCLIF